MEPFDDDLRRRIQADPLEVLLSAWPIPVTTSKTAEWPFPHYTDRRWLEPRTVFGAPEPGMECADDDRLIQWNPDGHRRALKAAEAVAAAAGKRVKRRTAAYWEAYLTAYHGRPVEVVHAAASVNWSSGHPVYTLGYRWVEGGAAGGA